MAAPKPERHSHADYAALEQNDSLTDARRERIASVVAARQRGLLVVMEGVQNPYNLAAIARTCDAFGVQELAYTTSHSKEFDPRIVGEIASRSASKWVDYRFYDENTTQALEALRAEGYVNVATVVDVPNATSLYEAQLGQQPIALWVGDEKRGLSKTAIQGADMRLTIPMVGMIRSFNVSVATAIILAEISRQRHASGHDWGYDADAQARLRAEFSQRAARKTAAEEDEEADDVR